MWPFSPSCCVASSRAEDLLAESPPRCNSFRMAVADPQSRRELWGMSLWVATSRRLPSASVCRCCVVWDPLTSPLPSVLHTFFLPNVPLCFTTPGHSPIQPASPSTPWALFLGSGEARGGGERGVTGPALKECVFSREATPVTKSPQRSLLGTGTDVSAGPSGAGRAVRVHLGWPGACFAGESLGWSLGGWRGSCGPRWAGERRQR